VFYNEDMIYLYSTMTSYASFAHMMF